MSSLAMSEVSTDGMASHPVSGAAAMSPGKRGGQRMISGTPGLPTRGGALAVAVSLHLMVLAWLALVPVVEITAPPPLITAQIIAPEPLPLAPPEPPKELPKVEPEPPKQKPVTKPVRKEVPLPRIAAVTDAPTPATVAPQPPAPPEPVPITAAPVQESAPASAPVVAHADPAPVAVVPPRFNAAYLQNPPPPYPVMSKRRGETGRVLLRVMVEADGLPSKVEVRRSSGFPRLDEAALDAVRKWKFVPARRGDEAVAGAVDVPIDFTLG